MVPKELLKKFLINLTYSVKPNKPHLFDKTEQIDIKTMKFFGRYTQYTMHTEKVSKTTKMLG